MNLHAVRTEISELLARFVREIEVNVAMGAYDPNVVAETVLVPLLGEVLDLPGLVDLNTSVGENFPGVDLGDSDKRVAIQVTSDSSGSKVKETLETFFRHGLDAKFDRVILYVLTHRQGKYGGEGLANAVPDTFDFDPDRDVMDFRSVATAVKSFQYDRAYRVLEILRTNFEDGRVPLTPRDAEPKEPVYLNLIDVGIPDTLYVADFGSDRKEVRAALKEAGERIPRRGDERGLVQGAMTARGERFSADYHAHAGQILTFHDLSQDSPLSRVVDPGSIVALSPDEYYGASDDLERVFKTLLHHCLKQMLFPLGVQWQCQDHLFIFVEEGEEAVRREAWVGKREGNRKVYERKMKEKKPDEIFRCKHLAFQADFERIGPRWYIRVKPEHFFSWNGYLRSNYDADRITWIKKKERNEQVFNHLRFIHYFLLHGKGSPDLFTDASRVRRPYEFLRLGQIVRLEGAPALNDTVWLNGEDAPERLNDPEPTPPLLLELDAQ